MTREDLGRRAVACKHWRWMEGMAALDIGWDQEGFTTWRDPETGELVSQPWKRGKWRIRGPFRLISDLDIYDGEEVLPLVKRTAVPDLSDPATLGCLLALVREAWPDEWTRDMAPFFDGIGWRIGIINGGKALVPVTKTMRPLGAFDTEAECLVAALEAAP